jgi:hypothetical protein
MYLNPAIPNLICHFQTDLRNLTASTLREVSASISSPAVAEGAAEWEQKLRESILDVTEAGGSITPLNWTEVLGIVATASRNGKTFFTSSAVAKEVSLLVANGIVLYGGEIDTETLELFESLGDAFASSLAVSTIVATDALLEQVGPHFVDTKAHPLKIF